MSTKSIYATAAKLSRLSLNRDSPVQAGVEAAAAESPPGSALPRYHPKVGWSVAGSNERLKQMEMSLIFLPY